MPGCVTLKSSFDRPCLLFNNDPTDEWNRPRKVIRWEPSPGTTSLEGVPGLYDMFLIGHEIGVTWKQRNEDVAGRGLRPATHLEAMSFALHPETSEQQRERWIVAPGSFNPVQRFSDRSIEWERQINRCITLLRSDIHGRWLDFLFLDEDPKTDLWMLCVEA